MKTKFTSILACMAIMFAITASATAAPKAKVKYKDRKFTKLFNGENLDGWYLKLRVENQELAEKIFAVEDGAIHVFNDEFPNKYDWGKKDTHGLMYTKKKYSKYILRFEYKWGTKIANNYSQYQYDAGCYYHVIDDKIWPVGIEYQVRYDDIHNVNHTGDFYVGKQATFNWFSDGKGTFLLEKDGGVPTPRQKNLHRAISNTPYNGLNGEWNQCEIIVMGDQYTIHKLNGVIVNMATDLFYTEGVIGFQSETGEIFYRNMRILEFDEVVPMENFID